METNIKLSIEGQKEMGKWTEDLRFRKKMNTRGWSAPTRGNIHFCYFVFLDSAKIACNLFDYPFHLVLYLCYFSSSCCWADGFLDGKELVILLCVRAMVFL